MRLTWVTCIQNDTWEIFLPHALSKMFENAGTHEALQLLEQIRLSINWLCLCILLTCLTNVTFAKKMFSSEQSYNKICTSERASFRIHACIAKWQSDVYRIGAVCRTIMQYFVNICKCLCILFEELFWKWNKPSHQI